MPIRVYFDEDSMDRRVVQALRARGAVILTALEADMINKSDEKHLQFATDEGYVLYSFNVGDFMQLHSQYRQEGMSHGGIILARQQHYSVGGVMRHLLNLIASKTTEDMVNHVEFLSMWD